MTLRRFLLPALAGFLALAAPGTASAHAVLVSSDPAPGSQLSTAPGVVVLRFSEPMIPELSGASVTDPTGRRSESAEIGEREIRVPLRSTAPGTYRVEWKTVSPLDGHTRQGSFRFGVGVDPGEEDEEAGTAPSSEDLLLAVGRTVEYGGLLSAAGMLLLLALGRRDPALDWVRPRFAVALGVALVGGVSVVGGETLAAGGIGPYLTSSASGVARVVRLGAEAAALGLVAWAPRVAAGALLAAFVALGGAGHAAAVDPRWWGVAMDAIHLASAGLWAGGILALFTLRPPGGWRSGEGRELLDRFTPVALAAFAVTVGAGILRAFQELSAPGDLVSTSYGQVLGLKILGVVAMVPLSLRAWRRTVGSVRGEAYVAVGIIAAAAVLAAYPLPPARAAEEEPGGAPVATASALPEPGDVTLAGDAGEVLIGLTLRPGRPGPNEVYVYLLPASGREAAEGLPVELSVGGRTLEAEECGTTCRVATVELRGRETVGVTVGGGLGGPETFEVPELPAPPAEGLLRRANERMESLRTYRVEETLAPPRPPIVTDYAFRAPDRMHLRSSRGFELIATGDAQYRRTKANREWQVSRGAPAIDVPLLAWEGFEPLTVKEVGRETLDGIETRIISYFTGDQRAPIWFRLWIGPDGLVRRMEMRAEAHFMDHRFSGFDAPLTIEAPERVEEPS